MRRAPRRLVGSDIADAGIRTWPMPLISTSHLAGRRSCRMPPDLTRPAARVQELRCEDHKTSTKQGSIVIQYSQAVSDFDTLTLVHTQPTPTSLRARTTLSTARTRRLRPPPRAEPAYVIERSSNTTESSQAVAATPNQDCPQRHTSHLQSQSLTTGTWPAALASKTRMTMFGSNQ